MKKSRLAQIKKGWGLSLSRTLIGGALWLPALFLLAAAAGADQAGDFSYEIKSDNTITITDYTGLGGAVVIPSTIEGKTVSSIDDWAFYASTNLTSVTIPNSVTFIGNWVFYKCASLSAITVDAGNSSYSSLAGVLFDKSQTTLIAYPGGKAGSYTIPNSVTFIGNWAFYESTRLTSVTIGDGVTLIGDAAFWGCTSLTAITVDAGNSSYSSLAGVLLDKSQTTLIAYPGGKAGSYTIPNSVTSTWSYAFSGSTSLTNVTLPKSITSIGDYAFKLCTSLGTITVDTDNSVYSSLNGVLFDKNQTWLLQYPGGKAGSYTIPNSVGGIWDSAFAYCTSLTGVTIPGSVTIIWDSAFAYCTNLTSIYCQGNAPSLGWHVFSGTFATVYYLPGTTGWGTTFGGLPTVLWNPLGPTIQANDAAGEVIVNYPGTVSITVAMNAGNYAGIEVDWWVLANARSGAWYYLDSDLQWPTFNGNVAFCRPVYQGPLANLSPFTVLDRYQLPRGTYDFWFAVDYPMDGILDPNGQILFDKVTVVVQ